MIAYGTVKVGDVVVDGYGQRWKVITIEQFAHLRTVNPDDSSEHRYIHALNWPSYRTHSIETQDAVR